MKIKHNKYKNTGILFELLLRQVTSDTISGKDSASLPLIKKYFSKSELAKEYKLYQTLTANKTISEGKAESLINTVLEIHSRLNRTALRKEKYNLIKEIKSHYNLEEFFKAKVNNYKQHAAVYTLMEAYSTLEFVDPTNVIDNKVTLLEHITRKEVNKEEVRDRVMEEYSEMDKGTRILAYKMLIEKFNEKYGDLTVDQKLVLKEFINNVSSTTKLKDFVNNNIDGIKKQLIKLVEKVEDNTIKIKINEVVNLIKPLDKNQSVKDDDIITLLTYHQLVAELKSVK
jgi:uncharacterized protein YqgV (UPF0045/DUF77 family)